MSLAGALLLAFLTGMVFTGGKLWPYPLLNRAEQGWIAFKMVDMDGTVVHRWQTSFGEVWRDGAPHIKRPATGATPSGVPARPVLLAPIAAGMDRRSCRRPMAFHPRRGR